MLRIIGIVVLVLWFLAVQILDWAGRMETAKHLFENRGTILETIGAFLTWKWSPLIVLALLLLIFLTVRFWPPDQPPPSASVVPATPTGPQQSAVASVGSTINQTINQGPSLDDIRKAIREELSNNMAEFAARYPHGYVIFGMAPGKIIYETQLRDIQIETDWRSFKAAVDAPNHMLRIWVPNIRITDPTNPRNFGAYWSNVEDLPFVERQPVASLIVAGMYYEMLDLSKGIILVGFK
jgi:hypothetical protein